MKHLAIAGACLLAMGAIASADPATQGARNATPIQFAQMTPKKETADKPKKESSLKQRVKRAWKDLTGYKFIVACPAIPIFQSRYTCTETGKNREDARAKCQSQHALCSVSDAS